MHEVEVAVLEKGAVHAGQAAQGFLAFRGILFMGELINPGSMAMKVRSRRSTACIRAVMPLVSRAVRSAPSSSMVSASETGRVTLNPDCVKRGQLTKAA
jgi:hypothetical protein